LYSSAAWSSTERKKHPALCQSLGVFLSATITLFQPEMLHSFCTWFVGGLTEVMVTHLVVDASKLLAYLAFSSDILRFPPWPSRQSESDAWA